MIELEYLAENHPTRMKSWTRTFTPGKVWASKPRTLTYEEKKCSYPVPVVMVMLMGGEGDERVWRRHVGLQ